MDSMNPSAAAMDIPETLQPILRRLEGEILTDREKGNFAYTRSVHEMCLLQTFLRTWEERPREAIEALKALGRDKGFDVQPESGKDVPAVKKELLQILLGQADAGRGDE